MVAAFGLIDDKSNNGLLGLGVVVSACALSPYTVWGLEFLLFVLRRFFGGGCKGDTVWLSLVAKGGGLSEDFTVVNASSNAPIGDAILECFFLVLSGTAYIGSDVFVPSSKVVQLDTSFSSTMLLVNDAPNGSVLGGGTGSVRESSIGKLFSGSMSSSRSDTAGDWDCDCSSALLMYALSLCLNEENASNSFIVVSFLVLSLLALSNSKAVNGSSVVSDWSFPSVVSGEENGSALPSSVMLSSCTMN